MLNLFQRKGYLMMRRVGTVLGSMEFGRGQCIENMPQVLKYYGLTLMINANELKIIHYMIKYYIVINCIIVLY